MVEQRQTHPLTDFLRNHEEHLARLKRTGAAQVLTVDGEAAVVLQDTVAYEAMLDRIRELEDLAAIREGVAQADRGESRQAEEFFSEFMGRNGISG
jgi:hypothetical protein